MEDINTLTQKANSGDAVAMRKLGYEYLIGKNIQKEFSQRKFLLSKLCFGIL